MWDWCRETSWTHLKSFISFVWTVSREGLLTKKRKKRSEAKAWCAEGSCLSLAEDELNRLIVFSICISYRPTVSRRDSDPADLSGWGAERAG